MDLEFEFFNKTLDFRNIILFLKMCELCNLLK